MELSTIGGLLLFALFSAGGWGCAWIGVQGLRTAEAERKEHRARTTGTVTDLEKRVSRAYRGPTHISWVPTVRFHVDGREICRDYQYAFREGELSVAETVDILYDPADPTRFHLEKLHDREYESSRALIRFGAVWIAIAAVVALFGARSI